MSAKYEFIDANKAEFPIVKACLWMKVSTSGFYEWRGRAPSAAARRRAWLAGQVAKVFADSEETSGYRRVHAELARRGVAVSAGLVRRLMRATHLVACQPKPYKPTTTRAGDPGAIPDLLCRDFTSTVPGDKLVGDITYIRTWAGFAYLATVPGCATKECVGYAIEDHMRASLVVAALHMAWRNGRVNPGAIFHSDRGVQYCSQAFADYCLKAGVRRSMGRTGVCWDNAWAESFNATIKVERANRTVYPTVKRAREDLARYIELRYNTRRLHSALGYRTPREARDDYTKTLNAA